MIKLLLLGTIAAALGLGLVLLFGLLALPLLIGGMIVAAFVFWIWMLVDAIANGRLSGWERVGWVVLIWFTHWIGGLIYLCAARNRGRNPILVERGAA